MGKDVPDAMKRSATAAHRSGRELAKEVGDGRRGGSLALRHARRQRGPDEGQGRQTPETAERPSISIEQVLHGQSEG